MFPRSLRIGALLALALALVPALAAAAPFASRLMLPTASRPRGIPSPSSAGRCRRCAAPTAASSSTRRRRCPSSHR